MKKKQTHHSIAKIWIWVRSRIVNRNEIQNKEKQRDKRGE